MAMSDFGTHLKAMLESTPDLKRRGKKILAVLNRPDSAKKRRIIDRMERHASAALGWSAPEVNWSVIDWGNIIQMILKLLLALLPLLI